jgi:hypothetical protein
MISYKKKKKNNIWSAQGMLHYLIKVKAGENQNPWLGWAQHKGLIFCFYLLHIWTKLTKMSYIGTFFKVWFTQNSGLFKDYLNVPWMVLYLIYYFGADRKSQGPIMCSDWLKLWRSSCISMILQFHRLSCFWQEDLQSFNQS